MMVLSISINLLFGINTNEIWKSKLEIISSSTLHDLHLAIQEALEFNNDHLYEFYISTTKMSRDRIRFDDENGVVYNTKLDSLFPLEKGKKIFYLFDYCDCWLFQITSSNSDRQLPKQRITYPRVVAEIGSRPKQYPAFEEEVA